MDDLKNLLQETQEDITRNHKSVEDVQWVGSKDGEYSISWEQFAALARDITYDSGFGGNEIVDDLVVVGSDWWLERHEYDGSEWWEFKTLPIRKEKSKSFTRVLGRYSIDDIENARY